MKNHNCSLIQINRILIIGAPGAGKTTLSAALAQKLRLPIHHLDHLRWMPGWQLRENNDYLDKTYQLCEHPQWIMDGMHYRTLMLRLDYADMIIFLDMTRRRCIWRIFKRMVVHKLKGLEIAPGCPTKFFDWEFLKYAWTFKRNFRKPVLNMLTFIAKEHPEKHIIILNHPTQVAEFTQRL